MDWAEAAAIKPAVNPTSYEHERHERNQHPLRLSVALDGRGEGVYESLRPGPGGEGILEGHANFAGWLSEVLGEAPRRKASPATIPRTRPLSFCRATRQPRGEVGKLRPRNAARARTNGVYGHNGPWGPQVKPNNLLLTVLVESKGSTSRRDNRLAGSQHLHGLWFPALRLSDVNAVALHCAAGSRATDAKVAGVAWRRSCWRAAACSSWPKTAQMR